MSHVAHEWALECFGLARAIHISCLTTFLRRLFFLVHHPSLPTLNLANLKIDKQRQEQNKYQRDSQAFTAEFPFAQRGESRLIAFTRNFETRSNDLINFRPGRRMN